jgi:hypothetical protein
MFVNPLSAMIGAEKMCVRVGFVTDAGLNTRVIGKKETTPPVLHLPSWLGWDHSRTPASHSPVEEGNHHGQKPGRREHKSCDDQHGDCRSRKRSFLKIRNTAMVTHTLAQPRAVR